MTLLFNAGPGAGPTPQRSDSISHPAEHIADSASIVLNGKPEEVFLLFGAYEEKRWAAHWDPVPIYPAQEKIEEGAVFSTPAHTNEEEPYIWVVTRYEPATGIVRYLVTAPGRCWTITVRCQPAANNHTRADIAYSFTGWTETAIHLNRHRLAGIFTHRLKDWEQDINACLKR